MTTRSIRRRPLGLTVMSGALFLIAIGGLLYSYLWMHVIAPRPERVILDLGYTPLNWLVPLLFAVAATVTAITIWNLSRHAPTAYVLFGALAIAALFVEAAEHDLTVTSSMIVWLSVLGILFLLLVAGYRYASSTMHKIGVL